MPPIPEAEDEYQGNTIAGKGDYNPSWSRVSSSSMSPAIDVAQIQTPHNVNYPQHLDDGNSAPLHSLDDRSQPRSVRTPSSRAGMTTMEDRLVRMPEKRPLPWRKGVEAGADNETGGESRRKQIRFGCLLATRGEIQDNPCLSCDNGRGKFRVCVALDGYFKGACASCQLSGRPNHCSIKKEDAKSPTIGTAGQEASMLAGEASSAPRAKRRKKEKSLPAGATPTMAEKIPEWESARPQWDCELGDSHARQQMCDIVQHPWAPAGDMTGINVVRNIPREQRNSTGNWTPANQPTGMPESSSYQQAKDLGRREDTFMNDDGGVALIDTLPKSKQRQVYGLVSGLQTGIQGLQRELDALKKALGLDEE